MVTVVVDPVLMPSIVVSASTAVISLSDVIAFVPGVVVVLAIKIRNSIRSKT